MNNDFFVVNDQWLPCRWSKVPCRWWSEIYLSLMINEFLVIDQRVPCRWWSVTSLSLMINELLVDDQRVPCRWWSVISLSMINDFLVDDDQWLPCRWSMNSLPTPFASFPFISPLMHHRLPSHFNWTLPSFRCNFERVGNRLFRIVYSCL